MLKKAQLDKHLGHQEQPKNKAKNLFQIKNPPFRSLSLGGKKKPILAKHNIKTSTTYKSNFKPAII